MPTIIEEDEIFNLKYTADAGVGYNGMFKANTTFTLEFVTKEFKKNWDGQTTVDTKFVEYLKRNNYITPIQRSKLSTLKVTGYSNLKVRKE